MWCVWLAGPVRLCCMTYAGVAGLDREEAWHRKWLRGSGQHELSSVRIPPPPPPPRSPRKCVKIKVAVIGFPSLIVLMVFVDVKQHWIVISLLWAQEWCENCPGLHVPNSPYGFCGHKATLILPLPPPPNRDQNIQKFENNACMLIRHCKTCAEFEGKPFSFF